MKKSRDESKTGHIRPVNKATMDAPQEEFIEDQAGVVADDEAGSDRRKKIPPADSAKAAKSSDF